MNTSKFRPFAAIILIVIFGTLITFAIFAKVQSKNKPTAPQEAAASSFEAKLTAAERELKALKDESAALDEQADDLNVKIDATNSETEKFKRSKTLHGRGTGTPAPLYTRRKACLGQIC